MPRLTLVALLAALLGLAAVALGAGAASLCLRLRDGPPARSDAALLALVIGTGAAVRAGRRGGYLP